MIQSDEKQINSLQEQLKKELALNGSIIKENNDEEEDIDIELKDDKSTTTTSSNYGTN